MIYKEWAMGQPTLFGEINKVIQSELITLYGADKLDLMYKIQYGERTIPKSIESLSTIQVAKIIAISYAETWNNKYKLLKEELMLGIKNQKILEENLKDDTIRVTTNDSSKSVSAFNEDEPSFSDGNEDHTNDNVNKNSSRNVTQTEKDFTVFQAQLELLSEPPVMFLLNDVSKVVSLSIY